MLCVCLSICLHITSYSFATLSSINRCGVHRITENENLFLILPQRQDNEFSITPYSFRSRSLSHSVILVLYDLFYSIIIQTYNYIDLYESMYVCSYIYGYVCYLDNMSFTISIIFSFLSLSLSLLVLINQLLHFFAQKLFENVLLVFCLFVCNSFVHSFIDSYILVGLHTNTRTHNTFS